MGLSKNRAIRGLFSCAMWAVLALLLGQGLRGDWQSTWRRAGVTANPVPFGDVIAISQALEKQRRQIDVYAQTPDAIDFNYPRLWLKLFSGLNLQQHVIAFELAMVALYLACMSHLVLVVRDNLSAALVMVGTLSSVSLLAVERGNTDLLTFSLVYLATLMGVAWLAAILLLLAGALKLYPAVCLLTRAVTMPKKWKVYAVSLCVMVAYVWLIRADLPYMTRNTPHSMKQSYGVVAISVGLQRLLHRETRPLLLLLAMGCGLFFCWRGALSRGVCVTEPNRQESLLCVVFASVFLATFVATPNFEYRVIFLVPALPFCVRLHRTGEWPRLSIAAIVLTIVAMEPRLLHDFVPLRVLAAAAQECCFPVVSFVLGLAMREFMAAGTPLLTSKELAGSAAGQVTSFPIQSQHP